MAGSKKHLWRLLEPAYARFMEQTPAWYVPKYTMNHTFYFIPCEMPSVMMHPFRASIMV